LLNYGVSVVIFSHFYVGSDDNQGVGTQAREEFGVPEKRNLVKELLMHVNKDSFYELLLFYLNQDGVVDTTYSEVSLYLSGVFPDDLKWVGTLPLDGLITKHLSRSVHVLK
jgi:hypothetical protein